MDSIRNPKLAVIGASSSELAQIKILLASKNIELVSCDEADVTVTPDWVLENHEPRIPDIETCCADDSYVDNTQHWRGGSRKKGGKIGYRRN